VLPILEEHRRRNDSTRERWDTMASHRSRVMQLISAARGETGRSLCILGVGNANDTDLAALATQFERIVLIDIDERALRHAIKRLPAAIGSSIEALGGVDLTGILPRLETWRSAQGPSEGELADAIEAVRHAQRPIAEKFDAVASTCVLTQLIDSICLGTPVESPLRQELVMAVRNRHLETMIEMLNPGGAGVLVTDFVATDTAPEMPKLSDAQFAAAAIEWINQRNFFTGANPYAIRGYFSCRPQSEAAVCDVIVCPAWRWNIGAKQLAVSAVTFRRNA
jgi:hypothetical protein